jgi:hypothetical protein
MPSIRISSFGGMRPKVAPKLLNNNEAQLAQNVRLSDGRLRPAFDWILNQSGDFLSLRNDPGEVWGNSRANRPYFYDRFEDLCLRESQAVNEYNLNLNTGSGYRLIPEFDPLRLINFPLGTWASVLSKTRTRTFQTDLPVARVYALTALTYDGESPPVIIDLDVGDGTPLYDGDILNLQIGVRADVPAYAFNIYRTVSKPRTGEQLNYDFNTDFLLVGIISRGAFSPVSPGVVAATFIDDLPDSKLKNQTITSEDNIAPAQQFSYLGMLPNGRYWLIDVSNQTLLLSKLTNRAAWPMDNRVKLIIKSSPPRSALPVLRLSGAVSFRNSIIVGTNYKPIIVDVIEKDKGKVEFDIKELDIDAPCFDNTLCEAPFGAIYASTKGIVAVSGINQSTVSSKFFELDSLFGNRRLQRPQYGFYWDGRYYLVGALSPTKGICLQVDGDEQSPDFGPLTVFDHPRASARTRPFQAIPTPVGIYALFDSGVYLTHRAEGWGMLSSNGVRPPQKATYRWRSKKFVMAGPTAFSAAKVVHDASGPLVINIYVDGHLAYNREVSHSRPFRLPKSRKGIEWEIEVCGKSVVEEIHLATSIEELTESYVSN